MNEKEGKFKKADLLSAQLDAHIEKQYPNCDDDSLFIVINALNLLVIKNIYSRIEEEDHLSLLDEFIETLNKNRKLLGNKSL